MASPSRLSSQVNVTKLLSDLKDCVQELSNDFTNSSIPIDDDNITCQRFCGKLEQFLQLGFLERNSLFSRKKGYWDFFKSCLASSSCRGGVDSGIKFANNNPEVRTSAGRGRAFLRYCLAHACLGDALQQSLLETEALAAWYQPIAPLRDPNLAQQLVALAYELAEVNFDLAAGGHDLDSGWPTFARRQFGAAGLTWKPLSRSTSIASLSSSFNNSFQDPSSPPPGGMGGMESLPERRASDEVDPWWDGTRSRMQDKECQTESADAQQTKVEQLDLGLDDELSSLITQHETEVRALHDKLLVSENENKKLQTESQTIKMNRDRMMEDLQQQVAEYNRIQEKLTYYEQECEKVRLEATDGAQQPHSGNSSEETATLLARIVELEAQLRDKQILEEERRTLEKEADAAKELRAQLREARDACEALETQIKLEEGRTKNTKWEMSSLQSHVDTLLKENAQLRNDLTQATEAQESLNAALEAERKRAELIDRELTSLRVDLADQSRQLEQLEEQLSKEVTSKEEAESGLEQKRSECEALRLELQELVARERELKQRLEDSDAESGSRLLELQQLQGDTKHLHNAIIKLTKQKDALFKECYALKQANREATWQADHQVLACSSCAVPFSLLVRRHHCRICGKIFCGACSSHWVSQAGDSSRRSRSCSECHGKHQMTDSTTDSTNTSAVTTPEDPVLGGALEDDDEEEDFSVISEEEVVLSQCVPYSPNPEILQYWKSCEIQSGLTRSVASLLAANETVSESVWVRAGVIFAVPLLLAAGDSNVNVTWEFTTEPKCIAFSVLYKKDADIPTENSSILVPTTRVNSHQHPIKGRLRARREGLYTLMFDNSYSRFTGKKVNFSLSCEAGSGHSSAGPASPLHAAVSKSTAASSDLDSPEQDLPRTD